MHDGIFFFGFCIFNAASDILGPSDFDPTSILIEEMVTNADFNKGHSCTIFDMRESSNLFFIRYALIANLSLTQNAGFTEGSMFQDHIFIRKHPSQLAQTKDHAWKGIVIQSPCIITVIDRPKNGTEFLALMTSVRELLWGIQNSVVLVHGSGLEQPLLPEFSEMAEDSILHFPTMIEARQTKKVEHSSIISKLLKKTC